MTDLLGAVTRPGVKAAFAWRWPVPAGERFTLPLVLATRVLPDRSPPRSEAGGAETQRWALELGQSDAPAVRQVALARAPGSF